MLSQVVNTSNNKDKIISFTFISLLMALLKDVGEKVKSYGEFAIFQESGFLT